MAERIPMLKVGVAGIAASLSMLLFMSAIPFLGGPKLDAIALLSTLSTTYGAWVPAAQYAALSIVVFPAVYVSLLTRDLPGAPWKQGVLFGIGLYVLRGLVVMPIMGQGFFGGDLTHPIAAMIELFIAHCIYGAMLGAIIGHVPHATAVRQRYAPRQRETQPR